MPLRLLLLLPAVSLSWGTVLEHRSAKVFSWNGASEEFYVITNSETSLSRNLEQAKTLTDTVRCGLLYHRIAGIKISFQWKSLPIDDTCPKCPKHMDLCQDQVWTHTLQAMLCSWLLPSDALTHISGSNGSSCEGKQKSQCRLLDEEMNFESTKFSQDFWLTKLLS